MKTLILTLLMLCLFSPAAQAGFGESPEIFLGTVTDSYKSAAQYEAFDAAGEMSLIIPGLKDNFIPQGLAYYEAANLMLFSGYGTDKVSSRLVAVDMDSNEVVKEILLAMPSGDPYIGHAGGVCVTDHNIYIASDNTLYRLPLSDFHAAAPMDVLGFADAFPVPCKASFCQVSDGVLWVGEFHDDSDKKYRTDKSHHLKVEGGENKSWILGYELGGAPDVEFNPAGIPDYVISAPERLQGITFNNDMIYLSKSFGRTKDSTIYRHENVLKGEPDKYVDVLGTDCPLWILDDLSEKGALTAPSLSQNLCTVDGSVYISFESAAKEYMPPKKPSKNPMDRLYVLDSNVF